MNGRGRFNIPQNWLYIAAAVGILLAIVLVYRFLTAGLQAYLALIAGVMLILGNAPELIRGISRREFGAPLLNTLIGAGLVSYFFGMVLSTLIFWPISIVLLGLAVPLVFGRAKVTGAYLNAGRNLYFQARQLWGARSRSI